VWLRRLSTDRIERRLSAPADGPRVVVASIKSAQRIVALNDAAARLGLKRDMSLADARAMYPSLPAADADWQADRRLLEAIADWCDRYTPLIGLNPPDGLVLDITGCAHLFGGEASLARDLVMRLKRQGFAARATVADTVGCAWAVAHYGDFAALVTVPSPLVGEGCSEVPRKEWVRGQAGPLTQPCMLNARRCPLPAAAPPSEARVRRGHLSSVRAGRSPVGLASANGERARDADAECSARIVPRGETEAAILPLPVAALRIDPAIAAELVTMGLKRVADLAARPRAPLAARFGEALVRRLDQALGRQDEPITPRLPLPAALAEQRFAEPIALEACVLGIIEHLAHQLAEVLERRGEGARLIGVALFRTDGAVHRLEIGTGSPLRDPARVRRLFEDRLATLGDACDPGFGYDVVRLSALVVERCDPVQGGLINEDLIGEGLIGEGLGDADRAEELAHLIDRLGARFGLRRVTRLVPQDTHIPEFAVVAVPAHAACHTTGVFSLPTTRFARGGRGDRESVPADIQNDEAQDTLSPIRPIRLFQRPEPVDAVAEVPDGPPVRFRWRQVLHEVAQAEGPERIAMQWWRDADGRALTRDYFRVESRMGARVWLYREGLYGRETERPRWYLHGLFA